MPRPVQLLGLLATALLSFAAHCPALASARPDPEPEPSRDLPGMILAAIERGDASVRIPPGRYYVKPDYGTHLRLENVEDFTIEAAGVEMVCSETTRAILMEGCRNVTLRGLTIDYDPLPFTQGRIVAISDDRKSHTIRIEEGFPPAASAMVFKHLIYTPEGELRFGSYYRMQIEVLPENQLRIFGLHPAKDGGEQVGDTVVISSKSLVGRFDPHAVHLYESVDTVLEDVTLYASPTFGFFDEHSSGTVYRRCVIDRREGRLHSLNADGFHSKFAEVGPRIENCRALWMGDDGVNICGAYHMVVGSDGTTLRVLAKRRLDIRVGDPVQILDADGERLPAANVVSIERAGRQTEAEREQLRGRHVLPRILELLEDAYAIELDRPVELAAGAVIGSLNRMGNGFSITDSEFGKLRSRGILIKASHGVVTGNRVVDCHLQGIKISPEYHWLESGASRDLRVSGNHITGSRAESILLDTVGSAMIHRDIDFTRNRIESDSFPLMRIRGLDGGRIAGNDLRNAAGRRAPGSAVSIEHTANIMR